MSCMDKVCKECPFRRKSAPGYLGEVSHKPEEFLAPHYTWGETPLPCHMSVNWNQRDKAALEKQIKDAPLCRGFLIFAKQSCKLFVNPDLRAAADSVEPDPEIFNWPHEFVEYHK